MSKTVISRRDAAAQGLTHFYTGRPCLHGHDAERFVTSGRCIVCAYPHARGGGFNPFTQLLRKYQPAPLWILKALSAEEVEEMNAYLQLCANAFTDHKAATDYALSQDWQKARDFAVPKQNVT